jgi:hypothetical protein
MSRHSSNGHRDSERSRERDHAERDRDRDSGRDEITGLSDDFDSSHDSGHDDEADGGLTDRYRFSLNNGKVTNLQEYDDGRWRQERSDGSETWSFDGTNLIKTETERHSSSISTFSDPDGDGVFTRLNSSSNALGSILGTGDISGLG